MKSFTVGKNDAGQRLDKFITKTVPSLPQSLMYKYIRLKRIKVNSGRGEISMKLSEGDGISQAFLFDPQSELTVDVGGKMVSLGKLKLAGRGTKGNRVRA